jgi:DNA-binding response OmpR family regulator
MAPLHAPLNLLIVEDNDDLRDSLADALGTRGHHVVAVDCAEAVPEQAELTRLDLAIVDLNLPGEDGLALAQRLREAQPGLGIIMLTARAQSSDKVAGYEHGADIYLTKPVSLQELAGAVQALGRRLKPAGHDGGLELDTRRLCLIGADGSVTALKPQEAALLAAFVRAPQQRLEHWQIAGLLGMPDHDINKPALELHIVRLRKKLPGGTDDCSPIKAIRGWGYQLCVALAAR